jgi:hypothetical protein
MATIHGGPWRRHTQEKNAGAHIKFSAPFVLAGLISVGTILAVIAAMWLILR